MLPYEDEACNKIYSNIFDILIFFQENTRDIAAILMQEKRKQIFVEQATGIH